MVQKSGTRHIEYTVNIHWSEEYGCFLAEMPELPGCMADGQTVEEARQNIQVVAQDSVKMAEYMGREILVLSLSPTPDRLDRSQSGL